MTSGLIYIVVNTSNNKIYIGQTAEILSDRKAKHYYIARTRKDNTHFHNALRKYDRLVFEWDILEDNVSVEDLDDTEKFWISYYKYIGAELYNHTNGGDSHMRGYKWREESRKKLSESCKGRNKGISLTADHRRKISEAHKGKTKSQEARHNMSQAQAKTWDVTLVSPNGVEHPNITNLFAFCKRHGLNNGHVHSVMVGKIKQYKGWKLKEKIDEAGQNTSGGSNQNHSE